MSIEDQSPLAAGLELRDRKDGRVDCSGGARRAALLIAHHRGVLTLRYHAVRYEDLVEDQERVVRDLFAFIGEDFESGTRDFQLNARAARTASYAQVTEQLYDRSRYRYRHYLEHLQPVVPTLLPAAERLGYSIAR